MMKLFDIFIEPLEEMSINIDTLRTRKGGSLTIQMRTGNVGTGPAGQSEHPPAHFHVIEKKKRDVRVNIEEDQPFVMDTTDTGQPSGSTLSSDEFASVVKLINLIGIEKFRQLFYYAQKGNDPEPMYSKLKQEAIERREKEKQNVLSNNQDHQSG